MGCGRVGSRGRRTASTWSSALGAPPYLSTSAIYLYSLKDGKKRQLTRPPANLSDIHPVVSPDGRYLAFVRLNHAGPWRQRLSAEARAVASGGGTDPTDVRPCRERVRLDAGQPQRHPRRGPGRARIVANRGRRRRDRARVTEHQGISRPSVARSGAGVVYQNMLIDSNIWELPTPASPNRQPSGDATFRAHRVDVRRLGHAILTGWNTDRILLSQVGPQRAVGVEPRRIPGEHN